MPTEIGAEPRTRTKVITVRFTESEFQRVNDAVYEANGRRNSNGHREQLSQNEFCRRAIFAACGEQE